MDKGKEGGGQQRWITKFISVNIINFAKVDKGGGGKTFIHQKWIICRVFLSEPFPYENKDSPTKSCYSPY